jgi:hypothetical protein
MNDHFKAAVSVAEMARMTGLSRSRFYQLIGKAFPEPSRDEAGRPFYSEEQQATCLGVRRRNCGIDGKPVLFYAPRRIVAAPAPKQRAKPKAAAGQHADIVAGVQALGLVTATATQVGQVIEQLYPQGLEGIDLGQIIRAVFLSLKRQN